MGVAGEMWPYFQPNFASLGRYLSQHPRYARVAAFIPTGWADGSKYNREHAEQSSGACSVVCVPYSEHSNFEELRAFVSFLKPRCRPEALYARGSHARDAGACGRVAGRSYQLSFRMRAREGRWPHDSRPSSMVRYAMHPAPSA